MVSRTRENSFFSLELANANNKLVKQYLGGTKKGGAPASVVATIRGNFDKLQALSAEKLALARKVYAYVEANVTKIGSKMREMEGDLALPKTSTMAATSGKKETIKEEKASVRKHGTNF